jgi:hypothetical protein
VHRSTGLPVGWRYAVAFLGVLVVAVSCWAIWNPLFASFVATAAMSGSQVQTGMISLGSPANAVISVAGTIPGSFGASCVKVTYTGALSANVRLYLASAGVGGTGLAPYLTLQVEQGSGSSTDCSDFVASGTVYNSTGLADTSKSVTAFSGASPSYATGVDNWAATTATTRTYQFNWQLQDDNAAQSLTTSLTFTWEAQT